MQDRAVWQKVFDSLDDTFYKASRFLSRTYDHATGDDPFFFEHHDMTAYYYANDLTNLSLQPLQNLAKLALNYASSPYNRYNEHLISKLTMAQASVGSRLTHIYRKPEFSIECVTTDDGIRYNISPKVVVEKPFCRLVHFKRSRSSRIKKGDLPPTFPKVLLVAPYSGHFATLLRDTARAMLANHEVYITDWANAREVNITQGTFTLENYMEYIQEFIKVIGDDVHIIGVCQPAVPVLALVTYLEQSNLTHNVKSMILMGGPIDTRVNPTHVNLLAKERSLDWFDRKVISYVPHYYQGACRRVLPGFIMLAGFMSLNLEVHFSAPQKLFSKLIQGDEDGAEAHRQFYDEYRSVLDLPADYYLDCVRHAFQEHSLPRGVFTYRGEELNLSAVRRVALMTVEGERDDISGPGQTYAAQNLCRSIPNSMRAHHLQAGVGHYGVFNGKRWRSEIMPRIQDFIKANS